MSVMITIRISAKPSQGIVCQGKSREDTPKPNRTAGNPASSNMATVSDEVEEVVRKDTALRVALAREILNKRAAARWIVENRDIDASFDTIYDAVEDYNPDSVGSDIPEAWEVLEGRGLQRFRKVVSLTLKRTRQSFAALGGLFDPNVFAYQDNYRIIPSRGVILLIVDEKREDEVTEIIGSEFVVDRNEDLVQITLMAGMDQDVPSEMDEETLRELLEDQESMADEQKMDGTSLAVVTMALASAGIDVSSIANGGTEQFIVIPEDQSEDACRILQELLAGPSG